MRGPAATYRDFRAMLRGYIARRLRDPEDVEDVLQDVFLRVTRHSDALRNAKEPVAWLRAVAKSAIIDHLRKRKKHACARGDVALAEVLADPGTASVADFWSCLSPLVDALGPPYVDVIRYVDLEGGRQTDFAAQSGLSVSTVKSRVQRARRQLKAAILARCVVERDSLGNVVQLAPGDCSARCC